jgi:hypothetical protein
MKTLNIVAVCVVASACAVLTVHGAGSPSSQPQWQNVVDGDGKMHVPADYRAKYEFLGTWVVAGEGQAAKELHVVYASPGAIDGFRSGKRFADGTVLVKEVFEAKTAPMTTGTVSSANTLKGWFVMVKDAKGRYSGNKLWGDGWGWAWFDAADPVKTTSTNYKFNCQGCHVPARDSDWIYVGGYPPLR